MSLLQEGCEDSGWRIGKALPPVGVAQPLWVALPLVQIDLKMANWILGCSHPQKDRKVDSRRLQMIFTAIKQEVGFSLFQSFQSILGLLHSIFNISGSTPFLGRQKVPPSCHPPPEAWNPEQSRVA